MPSSADRAYDRDLVGYGGAPPRVQWPGMARICVQFVVNYEEGGESCLLHGDAASEAFLSEIVNATPWPGQRNMNMESIYEYGSRVGFWRLHRLFSERGIPVTVFGVATAMARNPYAVAAMQRAGWEIASHGLKWIDYHDFSRHDEKSHIDEAVRIHTEVTGERPLGFYQGRNSAHTLDLAMAEGGFLYTADSYADELPYWVEGPHGPHLIVPYTLDANDMRFATTQGFNSGYQFFAYLKDSFDMLYEEGKEHPAMLSIGLHCRLAGRPGRAAALARFLDYIKGYADVWHATRLDVARHWINHHPPEGGYKPSRLSKALFLERFGGVFEHSAWVAEQAHAAGLGATEDMAAGLHAAMTKALMTASDTAKLALIMAHPDLGGHLAQARKLTADSSAEQASAGLDRLTPAELARFTALNEAYRAKFGFQFVMAIKGRSKAEIIAAFERRFVNSREQEFAEALVQIGEIARLRLEDLLAA